MRFLRSPFLVAASVVACGNTGGPGDPGSNGTPPVDKLGKLPGPTPPEFDEIASFGIDGDGRLYLCGTLGGTGRPTLRRYISSDQGELHWDTGYATPEGEHVGGVGGSSISGFLICPRFAILFDGTAIFPGGFKTTEISPSGVIVGEVDVGALVARSDDGHVLVSRKQGSSLDTSVLETYQLPATPIVPAGSVEVPYTLGVVTIANDETIFAKMTVNDAGVSRHVMGAFNSNGNLLFQTPTNAANDSSFCFLISIHTSADRVWALDTNCNRLHVLSTTGEHLGLVDPGAADQFVLPGLLGGGLATHPDGTVYALAEKDDRPYVVVVYRP